MKRSRNRGKFDRNWVRWRLRQEEKGTGNTCSVYDSSEEQVKKWKRWEQELGGKRLETRRGGDRDWQRRG